MALNGASGGAVFPATGPAATGAVPAGTTSTAGPTGTRPAPAAARAAGAAGTGRLPLRWALLAALVGGLALAGAFPPVGIWPLAAGGPALLVLALDRQGLRGAFGIGLVFGIAFFVPLLSWLINVAWYAWAALAVAEAVIFGLLAVGQRLLLRLPAWPLAVAGWWVAAEALRARWPYAFPWGRLAMSQAGAPTAGWAAIGGPPLLSFLVALAGATAAWVVLGAVRQRQHVPGAAGPRYRPRRMLAALALAGTAGLALAGALLPVDQPGAASRSAVIAAIQGDVPHARNLPDLLRASTVTQNHAAATKALAAQVSSGARAAPDVVIWPENSTDLDPAEYPAIYAAIASAVGAIDRPVLVGALLENPLRNTGQLWLPRRGPVATYVKRQLVPFGEYIPFRSLLSHITPLVNLQPVNFTPGHRAVVFRLGKIRLGDVICYEIGFDGLVRSEVTAGANVLALQSNDATFEVDGQPGESVQQVAMARIQAVTSDRAVVYASTTGESAIIGPDGTVLTHSGLWQRAVLEARVPLRSDITLADRLGSWPEAVITALTILALGWAIAGAVRHGRRSSPA
ncbi:MAG TPA: apolipoprotein N-acyltransferase [Streptosporangiaceae bacterium]|nr:apolipoprotein N-acyltransferase [Streptosporangiaceae bacterium]